MASPPSIKTPCFIKFLLSKNCKPAEGKKHNKWKCPGCFRSVIFDRSEKEIPYLHVKNAMRNLGTTMAAFKAWAAKNC